MNVFCRTFFCAIVLLFIGKTGSDILALEKGCGLTIYSAVSSDWMEETSEEDSTEFEDDDATTEGKSAASLCHSGVCPLLSRDFNFKELIREVIPPPPQG